MGRLRYTTNKQILAVVTSSSGTGKTTSIRKFKESLDPGKYMIMFVEDSKFTARNLYRGLLDQLICDANYYCGDAKRQHQREIEVIKGIYNLEPVSS